MIARTPSWPLVDPKDDGIRPAGPPDKCFYCRQQVGSLHRADCVTVKKRIEMRVVITWPDDTTEIGRWRFDEPHAWDRDTSEFHKNESSWCANNLIPDLDSTTFDEKTKERLRALPDDEPCLCHFVEFEWVSVVDETPRRALREEPS